MSKNNNGKCEICVSTGIIRATLMYKEVDGKLYDDHIDVVLCGSPLHDVSVGQENMAAMEEGSGLPVAIVGVQQPA